MKKFVFIKPSMMVSAFVLMTAISPLKAMDVKDVKDYLHEKHIADDIQPLSEKLSFYSPRNSIFEANAKI